jgi:hypothetical protein
MKRRLLAAIPMVGVVLAVVGCGGNATFEVRDRVQVAPSLTSG